MPIGLKPNASSTSNEHNSVYTNEERGFEKDSHTVTICVSVIIACAVILLCALLCYREVTRRRKLVELNEEKARRQTIRQAVRMKLQELECVKDSAPFMESVGIKVRLVTFGDVTTINHTNDEMQSPVPKRKSHDNQSRHRHQYHILHHNHKEGKKRVNHIPYRSSNGHLSYHLQQKIRNVRHQNGNGYHTQDHRTHHEHANQQNHKNRQQINLFKGKHLNIGNIPGSAITDLGNGNYLSPAYLASSDAYLTRLGMFV